MPANTALRQPLATVERGEPVPMPLAEAVRWKRRHLLSALSDRRPLREIGGLGAYLAQVRWSLWWALRSAPARSDAS